MKSISLKRTVAMLMVLCMLFSFAGCKKKVSSGSSDYDVEYVYEYEEDSQVQSGDGNASNAAPNNTSSGKKNTGKGASGDVSVNPSDAIVDPALEKDVTITLGISTTEKPEMESILPAFNAKYPHVTVKLEEIAASLKDITPKWTSLAAAGKLPDVVIGSENFGYIMQQGWAYPLDNLLASDSNKNDVLTMGLDRYRYEGKLYALPFRLQFNTIFVNTDLLNSLNLQKPGYDWNLSTFMSLAKGATTDKTSGINYIYNGGNSTYGFDNKVLSAYLPDGYEQYGFNMKQGVFDLSANNAFVASNNYIKELKSVPALVSDDLKYSSTGGVTDYEARFGKDADAFVSGKVLFGNHNTWEMDWFMYTLQYNADMYPIPTADNIQQRIQTHVDFVFMNSKCTKKNYVAAYALCRFLSYDTDGCNARIDYMMNSKKERGSFTFYGPASASQAVLDKFKSQSKLPGGIKYMLEKVVNDPTHTQVADCDKVVPDFWSNVDQYRKSVNEKITEGADPAALVGDLQTKINAATKSSLEYLSKQVKANQDKFYSSHDYETR